MESVQNIVRSIAAINRFIRYAKIELAKFLGLNPTEYELLYTLFVHQRSMSVKELSAEMFLSSQAITKITKNLILLNYLESNKSSTDKRVTFITLSKLGFISMQKGEIVRDQMIKTVIQNIENQDIEKTEFVLKKIKDNIKGSTGDFTKFLQNFGNENSPVYL